MKKNSNSLWKHIFYYEMQPNFYDVIFACIMNFHKVTTKLQETGALCISWKCFEVYNNDIEFKTKNRQKTKKHSKKKN